MIELNLYRDLTSDHGTFGTMKLPNGKMVQTAELPWRDTNQDGKDDSGTSCIKPGRYDAIWTLSPRFGKKLYRLVDKQTGRVGILIHVGNYAGDKAKGFRSDVEGCIALGLTRTRMEGQTAIGSSAPAIAAFHALLAEKPFTLVVHPIIEGQVP